MDYVAEIKVGNKLVFEEVYFRYHERFYFYVLKNTSSDDLAEEVVQMTFIRIWEKRAGLSDAFPIEVQIARVARSIMVDLLRKKAVEHRALNIIKERAETITSDDPIASKQIIEKVTEAIDDLPTQCRKIFKLSREEGLTYSEIANLLSISPKTVENQISKALKVVGQVAVLHCD